jgi:AcrR family transcriptional regulator
MEEVKLSRREREKLSHRRQVLAAALELFSEKGYHNVSMHEIAESAEFAIGTLYKFFKNKEDLYKALMMEKAEEFHRILNGVLSKNDDILTIIRSYIAAKSSIFANSIATLRLYFAETRGASFNIKAGLDQDIRKLYDELVEKLASVLEKGIRANVLREVNPYYLAVALEGLTNAFLFCWLEDPDRHPYEANVPLITELFLRGCLAK